MDVYISPLVTLRHVVGAMALLSLYIITGALAFTVTSNMNSLAHIALAGGDEAMVHTVVQLFNTVRTTNLTLPSTTPTATNSTRSCTTNYAQPQDSVSLPIWNPLLSKASANNTSRGRRTPHPFVSHPPFSHSQPASIHDNPPSTKTPTPTFTAAPGSSPLSTLATITTADTDETNSPTRFPFHKLNPGLPAPTTPPLPTLAARQQTPTSSDDDTNDSGIEKVTVPKIIPKVPKVPKPKPKLTTGRNGVVVVVGGTEALGDDWRLVSTTVTSTSKGPRTTKATTYTSVYVTRNGGSVGRRGRALDGAKGAVVGVGIGVVRVLL